MITAKITGVEQVVLRFERIPEEIRGVLSRTIERLAIQLVAYIRENKLSGNPLHRRTGDLSRAVAYVKADDGLSAKVGVNMGTGGKFIAYARYQEYGFSGAVAVREYVRRNRAQMANARYNKLGIETRQSRAAAMGTGEIVVRAHSRNVNYPAHSYLRSALAEMRSNIEEQMTAAVLGQVKGL